MANLPESPVWREGVYQIETTDLVIGGASGASNKSARDLADRTGFLKAAVEWVRARFNLAGALALSGVADDAVQATASSGHRAASFAGGAGVDEVVKVSTSNAAGMGLYVENTGGGSAAAFVGDVGILGGGLNVGEDLGVSGDADVVGAADIGGDIVSGGRITATSGLKAAATGNASGVLAGMRFTSWVPTISATGGGAASGVTSEGQYSRIGNMVFFSFKIAFTKNTLSGSLRIGGLPYAVDNLGAASNVNVGQAMTDGSTVLAVGATAISPMLSLIVDPSAGTTMQPQMHSHDHSSTSNHPSLAVGNITSSDCLIIGRGHYYTEAAF